MTKRMITLVIIVSYVINSIDVAHAMSEADDINQEELLDKINLDHIERHWQVLNDRYSGYVPELNKQSVYEYLKEQKSISLTTIIQAALHFLFFEVTTNIKLLSQLLILTILAALLRMMHSDLFGSTVYRLSQFVIFIVLFYLVLNSFYLSFTYINDSITLMSDFMIGLLPLIFGLMASFGNVLTVTFFHPILISAIYLSIPLIEKIILPLLLLSCFLKIMSEINPQFNMSYLAKLLRTIALWILGSFLTVFITLFSIQGATTAVQDGVAMKATKFFTGNFIPVIGRTLSDATDSIFAASLLLKNGLGIIGLFIICFTALFPILKVVTLALIFKVTSALLQPISESTITTCLDIVGKYLFDLVGVFISVVIMFFLIIVVITLASNISVFLR